MTKNYTSKELIIMAKKAGVSQELIDNYFEEQELKRALKSPYARPREFSRVTKRLQWNS